MGYEFLEYERLDRVGRITLNRPEKLNALSAGLQAEIVEAAKEAEADPEVHALLLRGRGRAFSAGYDITPTAERNEGPRERYNSHRHHAHGGNGGAMEHVVESAYPDRRPGARLLHRGRD